MAGPLVAGPHVAAIGVAAGFGVAGLGAGALLLLSAALAGRQGGVPATPS
jgi:hypothetical protein